MAEVFTKHTFPDCDGAPRMLLLWRCNRSSGRHEPPTKTKRALEAGEIQRAWRTASGRWFAIKPRLLEAEPQLRPGQSDD